MSNRSLQLIVASFVALLLTACGRPDATSGPDQAALTSSGPKGKADPDTSLGFPLFATKNTIRVAGTDPFSDAAAVARAVFTGGSPQARPKVVTLVNVHAWQAAIAASALMAPPVRSPILLANGNILPDSTKKALAALAPAGSAAAGGAQVIRVGTLATPSLKSTDISAPDIFALTRKIDSFVSAARGSTSERVMVVSADAPAFAMPAAAWAAKSGDTVLFTHRDSLPPDTIAAIKQHTRPHIYVLGPSTIIKPAVTRELRKLGPTTRLGGPDPEANSIDFARYIQGRFGWGVVDPGHGLVFERANANPALAAGASALSSSGTYGPLLLLGAPGALTQPMARYLLDIQPGYANDPVRGVYNRGWLVGDVGAITPALQSQIDRYLEIVPVSEKG